MTALNLLRESKRQEIIKKHGDKAFAFLYQANFKDGSERELEECILYFAKLKGFQAERVKVKPNRVDNRIRYVDVVGRTRTIGRVTWTKSSMTAGSADMSLTIPKKIGGQVYGLSVKAEIKIGKDWQKYNQKYYEEAIQQASGQYWIIRSFEDFYLKYEALMQS